LYVWLNAAALVCLFALALHTTWWVMLGAVGFVPLMRGNLIVTRGAAGPKLIPVLQLTGLGELLYAVGIFAGLLIGR
jgi:1,4-dihydroxy-2-naphthoate octaprenyltransferase